MLESGKYQVCSRKFDGKLKVLGVFDTREEAEDKQRTFELVGIQRMVSHEGILSSVERILRCCSNNDSNNS